MLTKRKSRTPIVLGGGRKKEKGRWGGFPERSRRPGLSCKTGDGGNGKQGKGVFGKVVLQSTAIRESAGRFVQQKKKKKR